MAIRYLPAECWSGCEDDTCPYFHWDSWLVIGEDDGEEYGPFNSEWEAIKANKRHMLLDD